jgi:hypothetical protein
MRYKPEFEVVRVRRGGVFLTRRHHLPNEIEPATIRVVPVLGRSVFKDLAFFRRVDVDLFKQRSKRCRIDQIPLNCEILAENAIAFFSVAAIYGPVYCCRCLAIIPDRLVSDPHFCHRHVVSTVQRLRRRWHRRNRAEGNWTGPGRGAPRQTRIFTVSREEGLKTVLRGSGPRSAAQRLFTFHCGRIAGRRPESALSASTHLT